MSTNFNRLARKQVMTTMAPIPSRVESTKKARGWERHSLSRETMGGSPRKTRQNTAGGARTS